MGVAHFKAAWRRRLGSEGSIKKGRRLSPSCSYDEEIIT